VKLDKAPRGTRPLGRRAVPGGVDRPSGAGSYRRVLGREAQPTQKTIYGTAANLSVGMASPRPWKVRVSAVAETVKPRLDLA
jgi:hypothetical protein